MYFNFKIPKSFGCYAMTEQVHAMPDQQAGPRLGRVSEETLRTIGRYLHLFIV